YRSKPLPKEVLMARRMKLGVGVCAALLLAVAPLLAITFGREDGTGHPNVGGLVAEWRQAGQKDLLCSGTLIAPTVYLTAAHCTAFLESLGIRDVWVTFDPVFDPGSPLHHGRMVTNPGFNQSQSDP